MENVKREVADYAFYVVGIKNALKLLEEKLLKAEIDSSLKTQREILEEIHIIQKYNELLELVTLRKIGVHQKD